MKKSSLSLFQNLDIGTKPNVSLSLLRERLCLSLSLVLSLTFPDLWTSSRTNLISVSLSLSTGTKLRDKLSKKICVHIPRPGGTGTGGERFAPPCNPVP